MSFSASHPRVRFDFNVKVILLGDHSVGKSSLLAQLVEEAEREPNTCRCIDYASNSHVELDMTMGDKRVLLKVTDTGGQEKYRSITRSFYRGAQGCLLMFDAEKEETFDHISNWHKDLQMYTMSQAIVAYLVGINVQSARSMVPTERGELRAEQLDIPFFELCQTYKPHTTTTTAASVDPELSSSSSAIGIMTALIKQIVVSVGRLPSLTIEINPLQLIDLRARFEQNLKDQGDNDTSKGDCAC